MRLKYRLAVSDQLLYAKLRDYLAMPANTVNFPVGWADFCDIEDAQRCR